MALSVTPVCGMVNGRAVNSAHQDPELPITFHANMQLIHNLAEYLKQMGKVNRVSYF